MVKPLSIRNLVKNFGGLTATDDISFDLEEGQSTGLIGPNGAGKTTIFSQIMGEYRQTSGIIELYGSDISKLSLFKSAIFNILSLISGGEICRPCFTGDKKAGRKISLSKFSDSMIVCAIKRCPI